MTTSITIGAGASNYDGSADPSITLIDETNRANATGLIKIIELYFEGSVTATNTKAGTFYLPDILYPSTFSSRSYATIGSVSAGSKQTFSGLNITVNADDYLGLYYDSARVEIGTTGGSGIDAFDADKFGDSNFITYWFPSYKMGAYGSGFTLWAKKINGISTRRKLNTVSISDTTVKKVNGIS